MEQPPGSGISHVVIVIPARNEAARLNRLLDSLTLARADLPASILSRCVVMADSCTDRTAEVARNRLDVGSDLVEVIEAGSVGRARRCGAELGLIGCTDLRRVWIANTDADTVVPSTWLTVQVGLANRGYDAVAGTVTLLDDEDWCPVVAGRFERAYRWPRGTQHPHIHGCNLGVRASSYVKAGGWSEHQSAEDGDLWRRLKSTARVLSSTESRVATSARSEGRAPDGFAGHITSLSDPGPACGHALIDGALADRPPLIADPSLA